MVKAGWIPTPLVTDDHRPGVTISPARPARFAALLTLARLTWWAAAVAWTRAGGRGGAAEYGRRLRLLLEDLGGLWIKVGQLVSLRVDLFPVDFCRELSLLQVKAVGFPGHDAVRILEADLGCSIESFFDEFDATPFAAASMGQVHRGRLRRTGARVAVKVQRPHLAETFGHQLFVIRSIARVFEALHIWLNLNWGDMMWELSQIMLEEIDCRYEASSTRRMRRTLKAHRIYVPKVFFATERVLVTEFIDGVLMTDYIHAAGSDPDRLARWLAQNRVEPARVGERLALSLLRQLIEDNLFHGDLHPGNILLLRDNRVALIDFGACSFTEREFLRFFRLSILALATRNYAKTAELALHLTGALPRVDLEIVREKLERALREWAIRNGVRAVPYHEKSIAELYNVILRILFEHHCKIEWTLLRVRRALDTLDASLMHLFPAANYLVICADYFRAADRRRVRSEAIDETAGALTAMRTGFEMRERLSEYTLLRAGIVRRHAQMVDRPANRGVDVLDRAVTLTAAAAASGLGVAVAVCVAQRWPVWLVVGDADLAAPLSRLAPRLDWQMWTVVLAAFAYIAAVLVRLSGRLRRHAWQPAERVAAV
jgi:ubiquinone biosynthesis protein